MKNSSHIICLGNHSEWLAMVAHGIKDCRTWCKEKAARLFDLMLPGDCYIVPMPSHSGPPIQMFDVAYMLERMGKGRKVYKCLFTLPHKSSYEAKKDGDDIDIEMMLVGHAPPDDLPTYIIDNVVCSGKTAGAALKVLPDATVVALTRSKKRKG